MKDLLATIALSLPAAIIFASLPIHERASRPRMEVIDSTPQPTPYRPRLRRLFHDQSSAASSSLAAEPVSGSASSSSHPETSFSSEYFDAQHRIVELEVENERLKAENDMLRTELALAKTPKPEATKPVVYQQPVYYAPRYLPANCSNGQCGPRGIFGWRR